MSVDCVSDQSRLVFRVMCVVVPDPSSSYVRVHRLHLTIGQRTGRLHAQNQKIPEPGCRIGIVRRQIDQRPFVRESKNAVERAARHARIGTDAVDFAGQQQTLVVARVAGEQERGIAADENRHVMRRVPRRRDDQDVAAPRSAASLLRKAPNGRGRIE